MVIDRRGNLESVGEAPNSHAFHVAIWSHMLRKYELASGAVLPTLNLQVLGRLWSRVGKLDRADGLAVAATFDRCWFPREEKVLRELFDALRRPMGDAWTSYNVAQCINHVDWRQHDRGIAFQGSLASPWACGVTDGWHRVDRDGHACRDCGKTIQHAVHMLDERECCREEPESVYSAS